MSQCSITFKSYLENDLVELPEDFPQEKAILWVDHCIKSFDKKYSAKSLFNLLGKLITTFSVSQEFKNAINSKVPKIIGFCISGHSVNDISSSLDCLEVILLTYGHSAFLSKPEISSYLERFLCSSFDLQIITKAGNALHLLQQVGSAGKNGAVYKKEWLDYVKTLCNTMHKLFDTFFVNVNEFIVHPKQTGPCFDFIGQEPSDDIKTAQKLRNVIVFLKCALSKGYPTERTVPFESMFKVLKRGLAIDEYSENSPGEDFLHLLHTLQTNLLHLLKVLVVCGKSSIRKYSEEILKLLSDCLKRTDKEYFKNKSGYHSAVFGVLNEFIRTEKENINQTICDSILTHCTKCIMDVVKPLNENTTFATIYKSLKRPPPNPKPSVAVIKSKDALNTVNNLLRNAVLINEDKLTGLYQMIMHNLISIRNGQFVEPYPKFTVDSIQFLNVLRILPNYCSMNLLNCTLDMLNNETGFLSNSGTYIQDREAIENLVNPLYPSLNILNTNTLSQNRNIFLEPIVSKNRNNISLNSIKKSPRSHNFISEEINGHNVRIHSNISVNHNEGPPIKQLKMSNNSTVEASNSESIEEVERYSPLCSTEVEILDQPIGMCPKKELETSLNELNSITEFSSPNLQEDHHNEERHSDNANQVNCSNNLNFKSSPIESDIGQVSLDKSVAIINSNDSDDELELSSMFHDVPNAVFLDI